MTQLNKLNKVRSLNGAYWRLDELNYYVVKEVTWKQDGSRDRYQMTIYNRGCGKLAMRDFLEPVDVNYYEDRRYFIVQGQPYNGITIREVSTPDEVIAFANKFSKMKAFM